jgi:hypothetical protein
MALKRMDNAGIVVDDLGGTIDFSGLKGFSSDSPKNSAESNTKTMTKSGFRTYDARKITLS